MLRLAMLAALVACCGMLTGCCCGPCGPGGCGVGYGTYSPHHGGCSHDCGGCDSCWNQTPPCTGPLEGLALMRKRWLCGAGCGETYFGEWRSYPPQCCDPCEFDYTYHGGGIGNCCTAGDCGHCDPCLFSPPPRRRPFLGFFCGIYGKRYCEGCEGVWANYQGPCYEDSINNCGTCNNGYSFADNQQPGNMTRMAQVEKIPTEAEVQQQLQAPMAPQIRGAQRPTGRTR